MQAGTFGTVPAVAAVVLLTGRRPLAAKLAVGGTLAWVGAKAIKPYGGRARPAGVLPDVTTREGIEGDLGWISGHAAVSTTMAGILADDLPRLRPLLAAVVLATAFGRMYVGAHLPHDTVGGAGLGLIDHGRAAPDRRRALTDPAQSSNERNHEPPLNSATAARPAAVSPMNRMRAGSRSEPAANQPSASGTSSASGSPSVAALGHCNASVPLRSRTRRTGHHGSSLR